MHDPVFSITNSDGTAGEPHMLSEWHRLLDATSVAITMSATDRPGEAHPAGIADADAYAGDARTLCIIQPASDSFRAAMRRDANAGAVLDAAAPDIWRKWNGREARRT